MQRGLMTSNPNCTFAARCENYRDADGVDGVGTELSHDEA
jgi:hypothetical protein